MKIKNSRKAIGPLQKIVGVAILLIFFTVFVLAFFAPAGFLNQVAEQAEIFKTFIPGQTIDQRQQAVISEEIEEAAFSYCEQFRKFLKDNYEDERCLLKMPVLPDLKQHKIEILDTKEGLYLKLLNEKDQTISTCSVLENGSNKIDLCAVAGERSVKNFYNNYLADFSNIGDAQPESIPIVRALIDFSTQDYGDHSIRIYTSADASVKHELETNKDVLGPVNVMYKPDKDSICYIPTRDGNWACDGSGQVLDDDCLNDEDEYIFRSLSECGQNSFTEMIDVFEKANASLSNCLRYYPVQHELQKNPEINYLTITQQEDNLTFELFSDNSKISEKTLEDRYLCAVAGKENDPAENFFNHFFEKDEEYAPDYQNKFNYVDSITIYYGREDGDYYDLDIDFKFEEPMQRLELHDSNLMFQPMKNHLCFMPTNDYVNYADTGIDDDYIGYLADEDSREQYNLPLCSEIS